MDKNIVPFEYGMKIQNTKPDSPLWKELFTNVNLLKLSQLINDIVDDGKAIVSFKNRIDKKLQDEVMFEMNFEGYNAICVNRSHMDSTTFEGIYNPAKHDFMLVFFACAPHKWKVKLYTNGSIHVGNIAKKYGGGGHAQAAGFVVDDIRKILNIL